MNGWDIAILALLGAALAAAVIIIAHNKKRGKGCCGDCSRCAGCGKKE